MPRRSPTPRWRCAIAAGVCIGRVAATPRASSASTRRFPTATRCPRAACRRARRNSSSPRAPSDDFAYAFSDWGEGISPWRFNVPTGNWQGPYLAHAVLDRSLVRGGETVSMKLFVRKQTGSGFALPPRAKLERHPPDPPRGLGEGVHGARDVERRSLGRGDASRCRRTRTPARYQILVNDTLAEGSKETQERLAGSFRVEAFRVPLLRARLQAVGTPLVNPSEVDIDIQVSYLAGGGAGGLPVVLRTQVDRKVVSFPDYDDYSFAGGDVKVGREEQGDAAGSPRQLHVRRSRPRGERRRQRAATQTRHRLAADARCERRRAGDRQERRALRPAARPARRARVSRPQRRDADRRHARRAVAREDRARHQAGQLGREQGALEVHRGRARPRRQADGGRARAHRCVQARLLLAPPAPDRRLLRLRARLRHQARGRSLRRRHRRAGASDLRDAAAGHGQSHRARAGERRRRPHRARPRRRLGRGRRRPMVRGVRQRPRRSPARKRSATSRAPRRAFSCARRSRTRPCSSRSSAKASSTRSSPP